MQKRRHLGTHGESSTNLKWIYMRCRRFWAALIGWLVQLKYADASIFSELV